ncbi:Dak1-domain-containing protein [Zopfochytrium polystomum]|nr:Dak1-domain-containing protein [Zopfochytrium polystomum]
MSDRHFFGDAPDLVLRGLRGVAAANPATAVIPSLRLLISKSHRRDRVTVIAGGGSGHEPGFAGFVGEGILSAAVPGDVFASPSAKQVRGAIAAVPSDVGTVLVVTNYTGDNLHFGLACQQARASGIDNIAMVMVTDDVAVTRSRGELVGRRALAGCIVVSKIVGAAAAAGLGFHEVVAIGEATNASLGSIAATLDHAHVPGRAGASEGHGKLPDGLCELGLGLHNEPGVFTLTPAPPTAVLVDKMLDLILDRDDPERGFYEWEAGDAMVLLVNNMGGLSVLECCAFVDESVAALAKRGITPRRVYSGSFMTTLNAPGAGITLLNVTRLAAAVRTRLPASHAAFSVQDVLALLDAPHSTLGWPATVRWDCTGHVDAMVEADGSDGDETSDVVPPETLRAAIRAACESLRDAEPDLTRWDTVLGDGDCGLTCKSGAQAVLAALDAGGDDDASSLGADGNAVRAVARVAAVVENACGGTLGAIFSIFLAALAAELRRAAMAAAAGGAPAMAVTMMTPAAAAAALDSALAALFERTRARKGGRTALDAMIAFVEAMVASGGADVGGAAETCRRAAWATKDLVPRLGRAAYVGEETVGAGGMPPDPGAMAVAAIVEGLARGLGVSK